MATYYVDPADGGADAGTLANPWQSLQSALDTATAGDEVLCTGTETLAAHLDVDTRAGSSAGHIKYFGCNAAWTKGAAQFVLDADSAADHCLDVTGARHRYWFENFTMKNATSLNFTSDGDATIKSYWVFKGCIFETSAGSGVYTRYLSYPQFELCTFRNNGNNGLSEYGDISRFRFCTFHGNTADGINLTGSGYFIYGSVFYDNGGDGIDLTSAYKRGSILNCVIDDNTSDGIELDTNATAVAIIGNRISNNGGRGIYQVSAGYDSNIEDWNVFYNNTAGARTNIATGANSLAAASAAECGYVDQAGRNYALTNAAIGRRIQIDL